MIKFRTEIEEVDYPFSIDLNTMAFTIGSCFSDLLSRYFIDHKIDVYYNPYGNLFNPVSIFKLLTNSLTNQTIEEKRVIEVDGVFRHYDLHSDIFESSREELIEKVKEINTRTRDYLSNCSLLLITLGTAWVHELSSDGSIVANCHKQNSNNFSKRLLQVNEIEASFSSFIHEFRKCNRKAKILINVSPIRHTREGLINNNLSKSILRVAANLLTSNNPNTFYFPGYEILMDDLRDYRFYSDDLIHPNSQAKKYVIQYFDKHLSSPEFLSHKKAWNTLSSMLNHRPQQKSTKAYGDFLSSMLEKFENYPFAVDLSLEIEEIKKRIKEFEDLSN